MNLRRITGGIIAAHGLLRIIFYYKYVDFVLYNFSDVIPSENILITGAALFPFFEFFTGILIIYNVGMSRSIKAAMLISIIMSVFIVIGDLYPRLIYHLIVLSFLSSLYLKIGNSKHRNRLI